MHSTEIGLYRGILQGSVVFKGLETPALEYLMERGLVLEAKPGALVLSENRRSGPGLYVVLQGEVEVFLAHEAEAATSRRPQAHLNTLGPGHCLGEYSLLDGQDTSASAKALSDTRLFFLPRGEFLHVIESSPLAGKIIYRNLLLYLISRLRSKDKELDVLILR